jgi:hypothetical protein
MVKGLRFLKLTGQNNDWIDSFKSARAVHKRYLILGLVFLATFLLVVVWPNAKGFWLKYSQNIETSARWALPIVGLFLLTYGIRNIWFRKNRSPDMEWLPKNWSQIPEGEWTAVGKNGVKSSAQDCETLLANHFASN